MRKLILFAALALSLQTSAQLIESPASLNMDSTEFAQVYGSVKEYNFQHGSMYNNKPVLLIGTKASYVKAVCQYLTDNGLGREVEVETGDNWIAYNVPVTGIVNPNEPASVNIKAFVDLETLRTNKVTITGRTDEVIKLFLFYWTSELSMEELKKKGRVIQDYASDRIEFDWSKAQPVLTITKNPNIDLAANFK